MWQSCHAVGQMERRISYSQTKKIGNY